MDFNQVRYYLALADTLNFTRAAEKCYVSQPALTQAIKRLETELGGELINREGRDTELTDLGKSLRSHFEKIDQTRHLVRSTAKAITEGQVGELNIGLMCTIGPQMLAGMLDGFQLANPMVSIVLHDVTPTAISDLLLSGALDGVICARHGSPDEQLNYFGFFEEPMVVAFSDDHAFADLETVPLRAIAEERYVDRLHCEFRLEFLEYCEGENIELNVSFRSQREDWIQSMIRDGMGVSVLPKYSLLEPKLKHRPVSDPELVRNVEFAVAARAEISPMLKQLIDHATRYDWLESNTGRVTTQDL